MLRNGNDQKKVNVPPTTLNELVAQAKPVVPVSKYHHFVERRRARPAPPPKPKVYVIEVIQGKSRSEEKFPETTSKGSGAKNQ